MVDKSCYLDALMRTNLSTEAFSILFLPYACAQRSFFVAQHQFTAHLKVSLALLNLGISCHLTNWIFTDAFAGRITVLAQTLLKGYA